MNQILFGKKILAVAIATLLMLASFSFIAPQKVFSADGDMEVTTLDELQAAVGDDSVDTIIIPDTVASATDFVFEYDEDVHVVVPEGKSLRLDGRMEIMGAYDSGDVYPSTLQIDGDFIVSDGAELRVANVSVDDWTAGVEIFGSMDIEDGGTVELDNEGYTSHGIIVRKSGELNVNGELAIETTGKNNMLIRGLMIDGGTMNIRGDVAVNTVDAHGIHTMGDSVVNMYSGSLVLNTMDDFAFENNGTFNLYGGSVTISNTGDNESSSTADDTMGLWNRSRTVIYGGSIDVQNDLVDEGFRNDDSSDVVFIAPKSSVSGEVTWPDRNDIFYGVDLKILNADTDQPVPGLTAKYRALSEDGVTYERTVKSIEILQYNGTDYSLLPEGAKIEATAKGYGAYNDAFDPPISDGGENRTIYMQATSEPTVSVLSVDILHGDTAVIEVDVGRGDGVADQIRAESSNPNVVTVSPEVLTQSGSMTLTAIGYGQASVAFYYTRNGGSEVKFATIYVSVSDGQTGIERTVTLTSEGPGTSPDPVVFTAYAGDYVTLRIITENTRLKELQVLEGGDISFSDDYTFVMPDCDVHIHAVFEESDNNPIVGGGGNAGNGGDDDDDDDAPSSSYRPYTPSPGDPAYYPSAVSVNPNAAIDLVEAALADTGSSDSVGVNIKNPGVISLETMRAMSQAAGGADMQIHGDTMLSTVSNTVDVRLSIDPSEAVKDINLFAHTSYNEAYASEVVFNMFFTNTFDTLQLEQEGSFGQNVGVAMKLKANMETGNLCFYSYDIYTNVYRRINTAYTVDANGYVHFVTDIGGTFIITDGPLVRR